MIDAFVITGSILQARRSPKNAASTDNQIVADRVKSVFRGLKIRLTSTRRALPVHQRESPPCFTYGIKSRLSVKARNPNPSSNSEDKVRISFGPSGENRTHGLLNPIQARYQNCATPGYGLRALRLTAPLLYRTDPVLSRVFLPVQRAVRRTTPSARSTVKETSSP